MSNFPTHPTGNPRYWGRVQQAWHVRHVYTFPRFRCRHFINSWPRRGAWQWWRWFRSKWNGPSRIDVESCTFASRTLQAEFCPLCTSMHNLFLWSSSWEIDSEEVFPRLSERCSSIQWIGRKKMSLNRWIDFSKAFIWKSILHDLCRHLGIMMQNKK